MNTTEHIAGWASPQGSAKKHYFVEDGQSSLCKKYSVWFEDYNGRWPIEFYGLSEPSQSSCCSICWRKSHEVPR